jgi:hypothetical protein
LIDTVGVSVEASSLDVGDLESRGWDVRTTRMHRGGEVIERVKAFTTRADGVTLEFWDEVNWLTVSGSLPKVLGLPNDVVLTWFDTVRALGVMVNEIAPEMTGDSLLPLDSWGLWRLDPVAAWPVAPDAYIDALRIVRLRGTQAVCEPGSVRWRSLRSGSIYGRFYDKAKESGHDVPLPARLERQVRPRRQVVRVDGERVSNRVSNLSEHVIKGVLASTLRRFGLDRPILTVTGSRPVLCGAYGDRKGSRLWEQLLAFSVMGSWPANYSDSKVRRIERDCRRAGIGALSPEMELPPLRLSE